MARAQKRRHESRRAAPRTLERAAARAADPRLVAGIIAAAEDGPGPLAATVRPLVEAADGALLPVIEALGRERSVASAAALSYLAEAPELSRELRKEARRALHRLRTAGVALETPHLVVAVGRPSAEATIAEAWASSYDPQGERMLRLLVERPTGLFAFSLIVHEQRGIIDALGTNSTRRRFREDLEEARERGPEGSDIVQIPAEYARQLVQEAEQLNAASGTPLPSDFARNRALIGQPERSFERALIYEQVSPVDVRFNPQWLEESPHLLEQAEFAGWIFPPQAVAPYLDESEQRRSSQVVLLGETREQRSEQVFRRALAELLSPAARQGLKRRLEETAYILAQKGRMHAARLAVAAALAFESAPTPPTTSSLIVPGARASSSRNPFAEAMLAQ